MTILNLLISCSEDYQVKSVGGDCNPDLYLPLVSESLSNLEISSTPQNSKEQSSKPCLLVSGTHSWFSAVVNCKPNSSLTILLMPYLLGIYDAAHAGWHEGQVKIKRPHQIGHLNRIPNFIHAVSSS